MSATFAYSPTSPLQHRDIRGNSQPFKRAKDHDEKWSMGKRPSAGVKLNTSPRSRDDELVGGSESQREKVRPMKQWSQMTSEHKSHANKTPKPTNHAFYNSGQSSNRLLRKVNAIQDVNDHTSSSLSNSLLELLPQHANNTSTSITTMIRDSDEGILYSFDSLTPSPGHKGREINLGGLVEIAEQKWVAEQTERIVKGEYEVLDAEGETTILPSGKGKKRSSPKQGALRAAPSTFLNVVEDDGFELI